MQFGFIIHYYYGYRYMMEELSIVNYSLLSCMMLTCMLIVVIFCSVLLQFGFLLDLHCRMPSLLKSMHINVTIKYENGWTMHLTEFSLN